MCHISMIQKNYPNRNNKMPISTARTVNSSLGSAYRPNSSLGSAYRPNRRFGSLANVFKNSMKHTSTSASYANNSGNSSNNSNSNNNSNNNRTGRSRNKGVNTRPSTRPVSQNVVNTRRTSRNVTRPNNRRGHQYNRRGPQYNLALTYARTPQGNIVPVRSAVLSKRNLAGIINPLPQIDLNEIDRDAREYQYNEQVLRRLQRKLLRMSNEEKLKMRNRARRRVLGTTPSRV